MQTLFERLDLQASRERAASYVKQLSIIQIVPGVLQTEAYAASLLDFWYEDTLTPEDRALRLEQRMARARALCEGETQYHGIINEMALRSREGGTAIMRDQLLHLADTALLPHVTLQVVRLHTWYPRLGQNFYLTFPEAGSGHAATVLQESHAPAIMADPDTASCAAYLPHFTEDTDLALRYEAVFDAIARHHALPPDASLDLIKRHAEILAAGQVWDGSTVLPNY